VLGNIEVEIMQELVRPEIFIEKGSKRYDLHWGYQSTEAEKALMEHNDFLRGYIEGYFDALSDGKEKVACLS